MKTLTMWNPLKEMDTLHNRLSDAFYRAPLSGSDSPWRPSADILEDEKEYRLVLELPGLTREDLELKVEDEWIRVSGERKAPETSDKVTIHRSECRYGKFARRFGMPKDADLSKVEADFRNGLLTITVAKREEAQPRLIEIKAG